jgi:hypothetical protein
VAARRLLIVMLLLLGISTLGAALIPSERLERARTTSTTQQLPPDTLPSGNLVLAKVRVAPGRLPVVGIKLGQQLLLRVSAKARDDVEIPRLGLTEAVDPVTPARFDLLPTEPGRYAIRLVHAGRTVGEIDVVRPKPKSWKKPPRQAEGRSRTRAREAPGRQSG